MHLRAPSFVLAPVLVSACATSLGDPGTAGVWGSGPGSSSDSNPNSGASNLPSGPGSGPATSDAGHDGEHSETDSETETETWPTSSEASDSDDSDDSDDPRFDLGGTPDSPGSGGACDIDFLFVIDHSNSMSDEQDNLARSIPDFVDTVGDTVAASREYHVGVITTGGNLAEVDGCDRFGGLITVTSGADSSDARCGPYANGLRFMTRADDLHHSLACAARPGTAGTTDERPMLAISRLLEPEDRFVELGCGDQFLRDDALLVLVLLTDEEDDDETMHANPGTSKGSPGTPRDWYEQIVRVKGSPDMAVVLGLFGGPEPNACVETTEPGETHGHPQGAEIAYRLREFLDHFGERGFWGDVCAPNYAPFFDRAVSIIERACDQLPESRAVRDHSQPSELPGRIPSDPQ